MNKIKVTKSNAIINSSYRLSLNELRIVLFGLSKINPTSDDFPLFHRIDVKELGDFFDIGDKERGSFYDNIKDALLKKFWEREFAYYDEDLDEVVRRRWLIEVRYGRKDGTLAYEYNPKIKTQLQQLSKNFTSYFLTNVANMKSAYAIRLYEICIMNLNASKKHKVLFIKSLKDLKILFGIENKYKQFGDFKKRVLDKAKRDINKHSDLIFNYEVIKLGRSVEKIKFKITRKKQALITEKDTVLDTEENLKLKIREAQIEVRHWENLPTSPERNKILEDSRQKLNKLITSETLDKDNSLISVHKKILVVEDNKLAAKFSVKLLKESFDTNYSVDIAESGEIALEKVNENNYCFILLDIGLPGISGLDVIREIKNLKDTDKKNIPIFCLTAHSGKELEINCMSSGAYDVYTKPLTLKNIDSIKNSISYIFRI